MINSACCIKQSPVGVALSLLFAGDRGRPGVVIDAQTVRLRYHLPRIWSREVEAFGAVRSTGITDLVRAVVLGVSSPEVSILGLGAWQKEALVTVLILRIWDVSSSRTIMNKRLLLCANEEGTCCKHRASTALWPLG